MKTKGRKVLNGTKRTLAGLAAAVCITASVMVGNRIYEEGVFDNEVGFETYDPLEKAVAVAYPLGSAAAGVGLAYMALRGLRRNRSPNTLN